MEASDTSNEASVYLIFGGTGTLGQAIVARALSECEQNTVVNASRDELKHWEMASRFPRAKHVICDVRDAARVRSVLLEVDPHHIVFTSALKHVDHCEKNVMETIATNTTGIANVLSAAYEIQCHGSGRLRSLTYISTDKACRPVSVYGFSKALGERLVVEFAAKPRWGNARVLAVRFGNLLNSRGSILPLLRHWIASGKDLVLTDPTMTRFFMRIDEAVDLIWYAMQRHADSGDVIVPRTWSARICDLFSLFAEKYQKSIRAIGPRYPENLHEWLISDDEAPRAIPCGADDRFIAIRPTVQSGGGVEQRSSETSPISRDDLKTLLDKHDLW